MTAQLSDGREAFAPETSKRLMVALFTFAGLALGLGSVFDYQLAGVGLYAAGMVGGFAVPLVTDFRLFDERDRQIQQRASAVTLALFGWLAAIVFPALVVLSTTPHFSWGPASVTLSFTTTAVYLTWGVALLYYR
jgi:uncharacterized membrane protein